MKQKVKGISAGAFKFLVFVVFIILFSESAFGQISSLTLNPASDVRLETVYSNNTLVGYNLFVNKKQGIESVMLTEPTGNYALRSLVPNATNGRERRELSGVQLSDPNSLYSILSSTPIPDWQFGRAFHLFIPSRIVYGNPSSVYGTMDVTKGIQFNIRTFDHKYGDPNKGRFQNHFASISPPAENVLNASHSQFVPAGPSSDVDRLRKELREKIEKNDFLNDMEDDDLRSLLIYLFWEMERR